MASPKRPLHTEASGALPWHGRFPSDSELRPALVVVAVAAAGLVFFAKNVC